MTRWFKYFLKLLCKMTDVIAKHNAMFLGRNNKLLRIRQLTTTTTTTQTFTPIKYGLLYNWYTVNDGRGIAPSGWHVPTQAEFETLVTNAGGQPVAGTHLKEQGNVHWGENNTGDNSSGFTARGTGVRDNPSGFQGFQGEVKFWSSTFSFSVYSVILQLTSVNAGSTLGSYNIKSGCSIRLIKNNSTDPGTVTDYDGNVYPTVTIGSQVWMARSLIVEHYNNGDAIPEVTDGTTWMGLTSGALCAYNNDWNNV